MGGGQGVTENGDGTTRNPDHHQKYEESEKRKRVKRESGSTFGFRRELV